ncbi:MAG: hypothetical protein ACF8R7_02360 [Phycisphaerales bacterium JB039]
MSQFGMQMPGGRQRQGSSPDVFTALLFIAVVALGAASFLMWQAASAIGPDGDPFRAQEPGRVKLSANP